MPSPTAVTRRLPRWARGAIGAVCVAVGVVLTLRPFTSLTVLVWAVAVAAEVTGVARWLTARPATLLLDRVAAVGWVVLGVTVATWPDIGVRGIAVAVGVWMVAAGLIDVVGALRGTRAEPPDAGTGPEAAAERSHASGDEHAGPDAGPRSEPPDASGDERLAAVLKGAAGVVFGLLALTWPDVTLLVVAVVFGARTVLFGASELLVALRGERRHDAAPRRRGPLRRSIHVTAAAIALVLALVLAGVSARLRAGEPAVDAFYDTPADVPGSPGALLRTVGDDHDLPDGAVGRRILYTTTRADGVPAVASALVITPEDADGPLPVIAWAHGTTGVARACAPSILDSGLESGAFFLLPEVLDNGWALVATDYVGLGTEGPHPYLVGDAEARSVLDAVRAARTLDDVDLADETVVWGHSQGGGAALWTGRIAPTYAPDVDVLAVAALAPASDVAALVARLTNVLGGSIFATYLVVGYAGAYPDVRVGDYVRPTARPAVDAIAGRCLSEPRVIVSAITSAATGTSVFRRDLSSGALGERLAENVPAGPYEMPVLVAQGGDDSLILPDVQADFVARLCADGNDVDHRTYPGLGHVPLVERDSPAVDDLLAWTTARLAGEPFRGTCSG